jgi:hypothetical protein
MDEAVTDKIRTILADTPWAVSKLERLSGGFANFTFRGFLEKKQGDSKTVIIKHAEPFAALNQTASLDATRSDFEWLMLEALSNKLATTTSQFHARTPKAIGSFGMTKVVEDMTDSVTIKAYLSQYGPDVEPETATSIGAALGNWLANFHVWLNGSGAQATELREKLRENPMVGPRANLYVGSYMECTKIFPQMWWPSEEEFVPIEKYVRELYSSGKEAIHGDFWTGK